MRDRTFPYENTIPSSFNYLEETAKGWERQANYQTALTQLYNQAILGNSDAQFAIGQLYQYGIAVSKDIEQALIYLQLAAAQQDVRAEYNLGMLYLKGLTTPIDYQKGIDWIRIRFLIRI